MVWNRTFVFLQSLTWKLDGLLLWLVACDINGAISQAFLITGWIEIKLNLMLLFSYHSVGPQHQPPLPNPTVIIGFVTTNTYTGRFILSLLIIKNPSKYSSTSCHHTLDNIKLWIRILISSQKKKKKKKIYI